MIGTKNFTQFDLRTEILTGDYLVGYKEDGTTELRTPVQSIVELIGETDNQELSFDELTKDLTITNGNTVSLSSVLDFVEQTVIVATSDTYDPPGARKTKLYTGVASSSETLIIDLPRVGVDGAVNGDEFYIIIQSLGFESVVQLNRYIWGGSQYIPFTEPVFTFTNINQSLRLKLIDFVWTIENVATHGSQHSLGGSDPITILPEQVTNLENLYYSQFGGTLNGSISSEDISLYNANITEGTSLTESVSSLVITLNGQQFKVPLLPV